MKKTVLFKRRQVWLPTFLGGIVIFFLLTGISLFILRNLAIFLAYSDPVKGDILIVEGWLGESTLLKAFNKFKEGDYQYLITTGGPVKGKINPDYSSYAEKAGAFLVSKYLDKSKLIVIPTPATALNRTFLSAVMVREWFRENEYTVSSFDLFTGDVHARRTHILYKLAFQPDIKIGIIAAAPHGFHLHSWWKTSYGAKSVFTEVAGLVWVTCCFDPGEYESHQEK
jgi:hypothetical protein